MQLKEAWPKFDDRECHSNRGLLQRVETVLVVNISLQIAKDAADVSCEQVVP